jgi:DNA polymerase sigma
MHLLRDNVINTVWPDATVVCHGSTATRTDLPSFDIDLVVPGDPTLGPCLFPALHAHLESLKAFQTSEVIGHARILIIKGAEKSVGFQIDISINAEAGRLNVPRIRDLLAAYPVMYPLVMFGKLLLFQYQLDDPFRGGIGGITLQYMALFTIPAAPRAAKCISGSFY